MVQTIKFSQFTSAGLPNIGDTEVGLRSGANTNFTQQWTWYPPGNTASRPTSPVEGILRFNTESHLYEYFSNLTSSWQILDTPTNAVLLNPTGDQTIAAYSLTVAAGILTSGAQSGGINGALILYPNSPSVGGFRILNDTVSSFSTTIANSSVAQATRINIPDPGVSSTNMLTSQASFPQTIVSGELLFGLATNQVGQYAATANSVLGFSGVSSPISIALGDGQFAIGSSIGQPGAGVITPGAGINVLNGHNSITVSNNLSTYTTTATAAASTTLIATSAYQQYFTGSTTQTVLLPVTSTLVLGQGFFIVNNSSGIITVQSSGGNTIQAMAANTTLLVTCILTSGTGTASWNAEYVIESAITLPLSSANGGTGLSNPTAHGVMVAEGASNMTPIVLSTGQILIGSTGADPVAAAINSGTGILVGNGAGSITVSLAAIATLNILSNITGGSASPIANTLTATIDAAIGNTQGNILYRNATVWTVLAPGSTDQILQFGSGTAPIWTTATYPNSVTQNQIMYASSNNVVAGLPTANSSVLVTSAGGVPSLSTTLPSGLTIPGYQSTITPASLTSSNDTNVTLTLGGSPTVSLLAATSLTLGWTGQLAPSRGGTGISSLGTGVATALGQNVNGSGGIVLTTSPSLVTPTLGAATATSLTFSSTSGIIGTTTNDSAAAGSVGETISSSIVIGSAVSLTNATAADITSISLTAGDWDVWGDIHFTGGSTTIVKDIIGWISTTSATLPAANLYNIVNYGVTGVTIFANASASFNVPQIRLSLASTATVYLSGYSDFTTSTCSGFGNIIARRRR